jgi:myo-inositol 2-dehydrogenase/D-chiro-inositol 1-dehydrogenase
MSLPSVDFGHTGYGAAFERGDVYAVRPSPARTLKRPLRLGIAGAGGVMQAKWLPALRRLQTMGEPVELAGVAEPEAATRAKVATLTGAAVFDTAAALLGRDLDALLVLTADAAHVDIAHAAVDRGVPVLVEKPLSRDAAAAEALVEHALARGVLLGAVANKRFSPPYQLARALIDEGALKSAPTLFSGKFTLGYPYVDLLESGTVHLIDLMGWFMGPPVRLHARGTFGAERRLESAVASVQFASGAIGTLVTSAAALSFKPWERVEIFGHHAFLVIEDQLETTLFDEETGPAKSWRPVVPNTLMFDESFGGYTGLLENFLDAVRGLVPLVATGAEGAAAVLVIDAIRRSIAAGIEIDLQREGPA